MPKSADQSSADSLFGPYIDSCQRFAVSESTVTMITHSN